MAWPPLNSSTFFKAEFIGCYSKEECWCPATVSPEQTTDHMLGFLEGVQFRDWWIVRGIHGLSSSLNTWLLGWDRFWWLGSQWHVFWSKSVSHWLTFGSKSLTLICHWLNSSKTNDYTTCTMSTEQSIFS